MGSALLSGTSTATPEPAVRVLVRARREAVEPARGMVRDALCRAGWADDDVEDVVLAFSEALVNAISHGSSSRGAVAVEVTAAPERVRVRVCDRGRPASECPTAPTGPPRASSEHGRGLMIMRALSDCVEIVHSGGGTEVRLAFSPSRGRPGPTAA